MLNDEIKSVAERFIHTWNVGGQAIVDELAAKDIRVYYNSWSNPIEGIEHYKAILTQTFDSFPDMKIMIQEIVTEKDKVVVFWSYTATHQKGEIMGVQPSGRKVTVSGVSRYIILNGKVVEEEGIVDVYSLMTQLGALAE